MRHTGVVSWLATTMLIAMGAAPAAAQTAADSSSLTPIWLSRASYPQLAISARILGDVVVDVTVRPDGSVASAGLAQPTDVRSDSRAKVLLEGPALEAARESYFVRRPETAGIARYTLTYTFDIAYGDDAVRPPPAHIEPGRSRVTTLAVQPPGLICILYSELVVRGPKCLYLWPCDQESAGLRANGFPRVRDRRCLWMWKCGWDTSPVSGAAPAS